MNIFGGRSQALLLNELCPQSDESLGFLSEKNRDVKLLQLDN